ncbi:MAG: hypothetical protein JG762_990 [Deferribacteraceae bacterium]|jgi:hypothetical protein|nr:hypothetical protein [Deferribacteraceae bacterium]
MILQLEFMALSFNFAISTLYFPKSFSLYNDCLLRSDSSIIPESQMIIVPTPALVKDSATIHPSPPIPATKTDCLNSKF